MNITNYTVKQKLGEGGMAAVYLAEHNILKQPVAIKFLNKEYVYNDNVRKRFLSEARNMFRMSHPNIVRVTDLIDQDENVAFVMEYFEGETLKDYLEGNEKPTQEDINQLFFQMVNAVGYVHEQNLVHRDIKPSNFMVSSTGVVKLLDFGIAKNTDKDSAEYTQTGTMQNMGTPMYMSPEQVKSTKDVTGQSDIYSLGVVLWQMVMGQKPYNTNTISTFELQTKIVNENLPKTNTIFDNIIEKATNKNLERRFQNCGEIISSLTSIFQNDKLSMAQELTNIIDNDKTIIADDLPTSSSLFENKIEQKPIKPPKKNNYLNIGIIFVAVLIFIAIFFFLQSRETSYPAFHESSSSSNDISTSGVVDTLKASKTVEFTNYTEETIDIAIAYWDNENLTFTARGWKTVKPNATIYFNDIKVAEGELLYWYGKTSDNLYAHSGYSGNNQFCVDLSGDFNWNNALTCDESMKLDFNSIIISSGSTTQHEIYDSAAKK